MFMGLIIFEVIFLLMLLGVAVTSIYKSKKKNGSYDYNFVLLVLLAAISLSALDIVIILLSIL